MQPFRLRTIRLARLVAIAVVPLFASPAAAQPKAPLTHETMWLMPRIGAPAVSPDGKWIVYARTEPAYDDKDQSSDLWIVPADGSRAPRKLTATRAGEGGAAWSPDSTRLAFTARRDGDEASQIYVLDMAGGGEAQRLTSISTGASSPRWRPDGGALLFSSTLPGGAASDDESRKVADERKKRKTSARVYTGFPIRYFDRWLDDGRPAIFVVDATGGAPRNVLANTVLSRSPGFAGAPTDSGQSLDPVWAPDGQSIVFTAITNANALAYQDATVSLFQIAVAGGEPKAITPAGASYGRPVFNPAGTHLFALREAASDRIYNLPRLVRFAWPAMGAPQPVTGTFDRPVGSLAIAPDGATVYFTAEDLGLEKLYRVAATGGAVTEVGTSTSGVYGALAIPAKAGATRLFGIWESSVNPAEVVSIDPATGARTHVTRVNVDTAASIDWQAPQHFTFASARGKTIHNMVVLPPAFDPAKKYPLLVLIHGGPHSMWRDQITLRWNYHLLASPGYVVLLTNYTGSTGFGEKFAQDIQLDPFAGPGQEVIEAADAAIARFSYIDATRQCAGGASYGGHLANWLQGVTTRFKCLVSHAGLIDAESQWGTSDTIYSRELMNGGPPWEQGRVWREQNPIRLAAKFKTPVLVTHGERDYRVPLNHAIEYWSVLQRLQVPSRLVVFPDENHWILKAENSRFFYQEVHAWLGTYLAGVPR
ncbi:MAG: S9 family peptidase [Acidobacteria bacterium]|nr:S9 family peptidase [Acidobacteriota bacterium]